MTHSIQSYARSIVAASIALAAAVAAAVLLAPAAHAEPGDSVEADDGRLAQQEAIQEFADRSGYDAADVEARLRADGVPDNVAIELDAMRLVEPSEAGLTVDELQLLEPALTDRIAQEPGDAGTLSGPVVEGECGISYVFINNIGPLLYGIETGFILNAPRTAYAYNWRVQVTSPFGFSRNHRWAGPLANRGTWEGTRVDDVPLATSYNAAASGWAAMNDTGLLCTSAGPNSSQFIN